ncbi:MAG: septum formation protein Maf [Halobacteriovoraceae bacterium]|nr:septum formation protein Maf [Halobacteriovoraceae bacterium]MCB9093585.1 septum formation protein Maf [Halobacteriovoraceae bacterium]
MSSEKVIEKYSLVLGSASPRREEFIQFLNIPFKKLTSSKNEPEPNGEDPKDYSLKLAHIKSVDISAQIKDKNYFLITADTVVEIDGEILNKPKNSLDAKKMLDKLSGKRHLVHTSVVINVNGKIDWEKTVTTAVDFDGIDGETLDNYVATGEPLDKAGAYGIQGQALCFIDKIEGSYSNVVGLPINLLLIYFKNKLGVNWRSSFV